jgi:dTMP kinase
MADAPQGLFLSLDGIDGTGKSTQCHKLAEWFRSQGQVVTQCTDPGGTTVGIAIRDILLAQRHHLRLPCEAFLFMASRAQLVGDVIRPALETGQVVICDRFTLANVVYQGHAGGLDVPTLWDMGRFSTDGLEPDLTIVLDLPVEMARGRRDIRAARDDRIESRDIDYHRRVRDGFLVEARKQPERIRVVDASADVNIVHQRIVEEVTRVMAAREGT